MKITTILLLIISNASLILFSSSSSAEPTIIRFAHNSSAASPVGQVASIFQNIVQQEIGSAKAIIKVVADYQGLNSDALASSVLEGQIEITAVSFDMMKQHSPRLQLFNLPFVFSDINAAKSFTNSTYGERLMLSLNDKGFYHFGQVNTGMKHIFSKEKIEQPEQMKELIITSGASKIEQRWIDRLGAYSTLPRKPQKAFLYNPEIDGHSATYIDLLDTDISALQGYILETEHIYSGHLIISSNTFWQTLPTELKTSLNDAMKQAIQRSNSAAEQMAQTSKEKLLASKQFEITELSIGGRKKWVQASSSVWMLWSDSIGDQLIQIATSQR